MLVDKTNNQVNVIHPYKTDQGVWVFDDPFVGLQQEPFVAGIPQIIESVVGKAKKFMAFISHSPMPDHTLILDNVDEKDDPMRGNYSLRGTGMIGWLCPATLKYFKDYPETIYVKIEI